MLPHLPFRDRIAAGRALAAQLKARHRWRHPLVLGLPRGGVPVAAEVARALGADLDVMIVRKIGLPWQPEVAMGAIASGDVCIRNGRVMRTAGVSDDDFSQTRDEEVGAILKAAATPTAPAHAARDDEP